MKTTLTIDGVDFDMNGGKIAAIKAIRDATGMGLRDSKNFVEFLNSTCDSRIYRAYGKGEDFVMVRVHKSFVPGTIVQNIQTGHFGIVKTNNWNDEELSKKICVQTLGHNANDLIETKFIKTLAEPDSALADSYLTFDTELKRKGILW